MAEAVDSVLHRWLNTRLHILDSVCTDTEQMIQDGTSWTNDQFKWKSLTLNTSRIRTPLSQSCKNDSSASST